jgi:hypothetical protein
MTSREPFPAHDEFQFLMSMHTAILGMQNSYPLSTEGTLGPEFREAVATAIVAVKDLPGMKRCWKKEEVSSTQNSPITSMDYWLDMRPKHSIFIRVQM